MVAEEARIYNGGSGAGGTTAEAGTDKKENAGGSTDGGSGSGNTAEGAKDGSKMKVGLVLSTGGLGIRISTIWPMPGLQRPRRILGLNLTMWSPVQSVTCFRLTGSLLRLRNMTSIIAIASDQEEPITEISEEFPDQKISLLDSAAEIDGVSTVQTEWSEQTFLAGVIAGMGTLSDMELANEDNVIGVIMGMDLPNLREGVVGFTAGAKYVNPDVEVLEGVVGAFNDPGKGKEMGLSMYSKGADFIQCIAGASGLGVFGASKEADRYAFGVGPNQNGEDPDHIVASSVRSVDEMVYNEVKSIVEGTWEPGLHMSGMKENAVGCDMEGSNVAVPDDIKAAVDDIRGRIASGELVPCKNADELDAWVQANQYTK